MSKNHDEVLIWLLVTFMVFMALMMAVIFNKTTRSRTPVPDHKRTCPTWLSDSPQRGCE